VQIVHNKSQKPQTTKVFFLGNLFSLGKGEGGGGERLSAACKFFRISCYFSGVKLVKVPVSCQDLNKNVFLNVWVQHHLYLKCGLQKQTKNKQWLHILFAYHGKFFLRSAGFKKPVH